MIVSTPECVPASVYQIYFSVDSLSDQYGGEKVNLWKTKPGKSYNFGIRSRRNLPFFKFVNKNYRDSRSFSRSFLISFLAVTRRCT